MEVEKPLIRYERPARLAHAFSALAGAGAFFGVFQRLDRSAPSDGHIGGAYEATAHRKWNRYNIERRTA